jgi:hypothetical protein
MKFKQWLEIVEPMRPKGARKSNFTINLGTNTARPATRFRWKTSLGNSIDLNFEHGEADTYTVVFYVNGTLFDDAPKNTVNSRDPEILSTIMHALREKADALNAQVLYFRAAKSDKDSRLVRNLPQKDLAARAIGYLNQFKQMASNYKVQLIPPSQVRLDLFKKLNKPDPMPRADFDQKRWMLWANSVHSLIEKQQPLGNISSIEGAGLEPSELRLIGFDPTPLVQTLKALDEVFKSMTPEGFLKNKNRRAEVYDKLMQRYMSDKWNVIRKEDFFELTRKSD